MSASFIPPIPVGQVDTAGFLANDLGKEYLVDTAYGTNTYTLAKAVSGGIAAASQGKQLFMSFSVGYPLNVVDLNVTSGSQYVCGAIPSTLTGAIAGSGIFLMLVEGHDALATTATGVGSITSGSALVPGTGSNLVMASTGVAFADQDERVKAYCGFLCVASTATTANLAYPVNYRAPFR